MIEMKKRLEGKVNRKALKRYIMPGMTICIPRGAVVSSVAMQWNVSLYVMARVIYIASSFKYSQYMKNTL